MKEKIQSHTIKIVRYII